MRAIICESDFNGETEDYIEDITKTACAAMREQGVDGQVCILFTDEQGIRELNREFRNIDKVTDVLSFPANDLAEIMENPNTEDFERDEETGEIALGDIAICVKRAKEQAEEYGHSLKRELCFLTAHGCLHLMGYDHIEEGDEKIMTAQQKKIMETVGIGR